MVKTQRSETLLHHLAIGYDKRGSGAQPGLVAA